MVQEPSPADTQGPGDSATKDQSVALTPQTLAAHTAKEGPAGLQPAAGQYSRRAAANLISRLASNPARLEGMPELAETVKGPTKKGELISMMCDSNGPLISQENGTSLDQERNGRSLWLRSSESDGFQTSEGHG